MGRAPIEGGGAERVDAPRVDGPVAVPLRDEDVAVAGHAREAPVAVGARVDRVEGVRTAADRQVDGAAAQPVDFAPGDVDPPEVASELGRGLVEAREQL